MTIVGFDTALPTTSACVLRDDAQAFATPPRDPAGLVAHGARGRLERGDRIARPPTASADRRAPPAGVRRALPFDRRAARARAGLGAGGHGSRRCDRVRSPPRR